MCWKRNLHLILILSFQLQFGIVAINFVWLRLVFNKAYRAGNGLWSHCLLPPTLTNVWKNDGFQKTFSTLWSLWSRCRAMSGNVGRFWAMGMHTQFMKQGLTLEVTQVGRGWEWNDRWNRENKYPSSSPTNPTHQITLACIWVQSGQGLTREPGIGETCEGWASSQLASQAHHVLHITTRHWDLHLTCSPDLAWTITGPGWFTLRKGLLGQTIMREEGGGGDGPTAQQLPSTVNFSPHLKSTPSSNSV